MTDKIIALLCTDSMSHMVGLYGEKRTHWQLRQLNLQPLTIQMRTCPCGGLGVYTIQLAVSHYQAI